MDPKSEGDLDEMTRPPKRSDASGRAETYAPGSGVRYGVAGLEREPGSAAGGAVNIGLRSG